MDKLAAMKAFVAIVDHGSLTAAAEALEKAPPTMVRSLATLERSLGVRLLTRTTRRMALTEEGRVFLDRSRKILADVEEAEQVVTAATVAPRGHLRATAPVLFGSWHVAPAVAAFVESFPDVRVDLLLLDRVVDLVEEGIDVGVRIGRLPDSSMIAVPVGTMRRVVVASPGTLARVGTPKNPGELSSLPTVHHHGAGPAGRWAFRQAGRDTQVAVRSRFTSNAAAAVVEACTRGLGFGHFLAYQVDEPVRRGRLKVVLEEFEVAPLPVQVVYSDARLMSSRLRLFVDALRDGMKKSLKRSSGAAARD